MSKQAVQTDAPGKPVSRPSARKPGRRPAQDHEPDEAVRGRDRLSENERRPMDPGISDSAHS